jgi:hypothetical protein
MLYGLHTGLGDTQWIEWPQTANGVDGGEQSSVESRHAMLRDGEVSRYSKRCERGPLRHIVTRKGIVLESWPGAARSQRKCRRGTFWLVRSVVGPS